MAFQLAQQLGVEGVQRLGPVEGQNRDPSVHLQNNRVAHVQLSFMVSRNAIMPEKSVPPSPASTIC